MHQLVCVVSFGDFCLMAILKMGMRRVGRIQFPFPQVPVYQKLKVQSWKSCLLLCSGMGMRGEQKHQERGWYILCIETSLCNSCFSSSWDKLSLSLSLSTRISFSLLSYFSSSAIFIFQLKNLESGSLLSIQQLSLLLTTLATFIYWKNSVGRKKKERKRPTSIVLSYYFTFTSVKKLYQLLQLYQLNYCLPFPSLA